MRWWARWERIGLGLLVGAVFHSIAAAQGTDSSRTVVDTTSIKPKPAGTDSIQPPLARAPMPSLVRSDQRLHWTKAELIAADVLTLGELLARVSGITTSGTGWIANAATAEYMGDARRVRVFVDGVEQDELNPKANRVLDLEQEQLWNAEELTIEPSAEEIRVYIRTIRAEKTIPSTRTDVATGDNQTDLYRGRVDYRWHDGAALQLAAQDFSTTPPSSLGASSDELTVFTRAGWAGRGMSVDLVYSRSSLFRGITDAFEVADSIPGGQMTRTNASLRAAFGDPDSHRRWLQVTAATTIFSFVGQAAPSTSDTTVTDSASLDSARSRAQYVVSGGLNRLGAHLSATERVRVGDGPMSSTPSVRASYETGPLQLSGFAEGRGPDSLSRVGVTGELDLLSFLRVTESVGRSTDYSAGTAPLSTRASRFELGLRVGGLWFSGGALYRDSMRVASPTIFNLGTEPVIDGPALAGVASIRGQLWGPIFADLSGIRWSDSLGVYRPQYQTRSELSLKSNFLQRFPTGDFGLVASIVHEYRSQTLYPLVGDTLAAAPGYRTFSSLLEIRILNAVISWQFRNFLGERYNQVPGYLMPRLSNTYGVRWQFFN